VTRTPRRSRAPPETSAAAPAAHGQRRPAQTPQTGTERSRLSGEQFRYSLANAVGEDEAKELFSATLFRVPASLCARRRPQT